MSTALAISPVLRVVPEAALQAAEKDAAAQQAANEKATQTAPASSLGSFVRAQFEVMRLHRNSFQGWSERMLAALRSFNGAYDANKLQEIQKFGGSQVYARMISSKCRGATALLRDVYISADRPWAIAPPADPDVPQDITAKIAQLVTMEASTLEQVGQPIDLGSVRDRITSLVTEARDAAKRKARKQAKIVEDKIEELLEEGKFYKALAEFLVDLPIFPFACIKGPTIRMVPFVQWVNGKAQMVAKPRMFWDRVSPFDVWWTPGVSDIEDAAIVERHRYTRADINDLLNLPGYNQKEIRAVLEEYGRGGLYDIWDSTDAERAVNESRENPQFNRSALINCFEYNGNVQGQMLLDYGMDKSLIDDPLRDYMAQIWVIGAHVIKAQLSPSPRKRHPYFITSFEKMPGTPVGNGLTDILSDLQEVCNAALRSLVNNMSIASGPQVVINDDRLAPDEDAEELYPWKRWHTKASPTSNNTQEPISFFQPTSNAQELLQIYMQLNTIADDVSAIPRYLSGNSPGGGAGRTSSGLAMLMSNASKVLQTVAANIDRDVLEPCLGNLFDLVMMTDQSGLLSGEEEVRILGVSVAAQRETQRARQLEFLQVTANPLDQQIMGPKGRAVVLGSVANTLGLDGEKIVPSEEELEAQQQAMQQMAQIQQGMGQAAAQAQGGQASSPTTQDVGPRFNAQERQPTITGGTH